MRQGSAVHKKLEEQVHTTVHVDVQTREDAWGLRIWNVIQGLRTLRSTGLTRELEVWGAIDGIVVTGIIDELSRICPDKDLEDSLEWPGPVPDIANVKPTDKTIDDFFKTQRANLAETPAKKSKTGKIYICDVKTRSVRSIPSEVAFQPTRMQLMLYHHLISSLAANTIDFSILASRYSLDSSRIFSDEFIAQVGSLNDDTFHDALITPAASQESVKSWSQDSMMTLLEHNNLSALWGLMISEFQTTLPEGAASLGNVLKAEYISRDTGEIVGNKTFAMDESGLQDYLRREMQWWKGEREAQGVAIEEAFKCTSCEFAETCKWRLGKVEEAKEKVRMKRKRTAAI
jgi:exonuclease V